MAHLTAIEGPLAGQTFDLHEATVIGRSFDADIRVDEIIVSRQHTRITSTPQGFMIEDMNSGNGTLVNGEQTEGIVPLAHGDRISVGHAIFRFVSKEAPANDDKSTHLVELSTSDESSVVETLNIKATMIDGPALDTSKTPETVLKAHQRLRTVVEISNKVTTRLDMDDLLNEIMNSLFSVFPQADRGFIMLKGDEEEGESPSENLVAKVARERGKDKPDSISVSRRVIDEVVTHRIAILTADAMGDERFEGARSIANFQIRSMMCAPLIADEDFLGVIHIDTLQQEKRFTMDDLDLLTGVANQTAFAVASAKMHQQLMLRQRMERDLQLARQVQESFLPQTTPDIPGFELVATYRAALEVGGDFYDFVMMDDRHVGVGLGDVAGKGVPAALLMARMSSDMRLLAQTETDPGPVLTKLNARLTANAPEGAFVTAVFTVLDREARTLAIANAAHCLPVLRRATTGEVRELDEVGGFPLGAFDEAEYEQTVFQMESGDVVVLFSDGVTEAMTSNKDMYGTERLLAAVALPASSAREVMENILADVRAFVEDTPQSDDLTVVCIGVNPD